MNKVVMTGATSMIGVALIQECIKNNVEVYAIVRSDSNKIDRLPKSKLVNLVFADLKELGMLEMPNNSYEVFYHLGWTGTDKDKRNNVDEQMENVNYTLEASRLAKRIGCHTFIGAGSQAEYGRVSEKIKPDTAVNPDIAYGIAKYAAGKLSAILCKDMGLRHIWGRIFSVYGPYDRKDSMVMHSLSKMSLNENVSFTPSEQIWDYMYSEDAASAFFMLGLKGKDQAIYCIGNGNSRPLFEYIEILERCTDTIGNVEIGKLPYGDNQVMRLEPDVTNLFEDVGFSPKFSFEEGIKNTIEWMKVHK